MTTRKDNEDPIDIHNFQKRLERAIRFLRNRTEVSQHNEDLIPQFLDRLKAEALSFARQVGYVQRLTTIAVIAHKDLDQTDKQDVERLVILGDCGTGWFLVPFLAQLWVSDEDHRVH